MDEFNPTDDDEHEDEFVSIFSDQFMATLKGANIRWTNACKEMTRSRKALLKLKPLLASEKLSSKRIERLEARITAAIDHLKQYLDPAEDETNPVVAMNEVVRDIDNDTDGGLIWVKIGL